MIRADASAIDRSLALRRAQMAADTSAVEEMLRGGDTADVRLAAGTAPRYLDSVTELSGETRRIVADGDGTLDASFDRAIKRVADGDAKKRAKRFVSNTGGNKCHSISRETNLPYITEVVVCRNPDAELVS